MKRFNLSEWALTHRALVLYAMIVLGIIGAWSYRHLGQSEDPPFTFKVMVVRTVWPGASADEVAQQVTERIEKAAMTTGSYEFIRSYSRPGESQVIFVARDSMHSDEIPELWYQVRKKVGDIRATLPEGTVGPFFNDEFGDTFGNIYALTGPGFDYAAMKDYADRIQLELQRVADVNKVELIGLQDQKVWIELSNTKLATLGIPLSVVQQALDQQNAVTSAGFFETTSDRVQLRVSGEFDSVKDIRDFPIQAGGRTLRLGDIADIRRGFADPSAPKMRFMGQDAIGLAVAMKNGGDIIRLGKTLDAEFERLQKTLPLGMELRKVSDQPHAVRESVGEFVTVLTEAVVIVLVVSFFSLGLRTGLVVAVSIPLVLAMTFALMHYFNIGLHKISLGAAGAGAGPAGGRCDHRGGDDGDQDGAGLRPHARGQLRLQLHRLPHADRHAGHRGRFSAHRHRRLGHRRIHALAVPGGDHRPDRVLDRGGAVHTVSGRQDAARFQPRAGSAEARFAGRALARIPPAPRGPQSALFQRARAQGARWQGARSVSHALLSALPQAAGRLPAPPLAGDRGDRARVRAVGRAVPLRAAAVLPGLGAAGADGRHGAGRGQFAALHRGAGEAS